MNASSLGKQLLSSWAAELTPAVASSFPLGREDVTLLSYLFAEPDQIDAFFPQIRLAITRSWQTCGALKTVLVTNHITPSLECFAAENHPFVSLALSTNLIPGSVESMSIDCNTNLATYFATEHVLIVQNDGFPLRPGLDEFLGRFDYVGAPFIRDTRLNRLLGLYPRFAVGNGGFSLRSHDICSLANFYWKKRYYKHLSLRSYGTKEDVFYCLLLPLLQRDYRKRMRFPDVTTALRFSYDALYEKAPNEKPFGFHGAAAAAEFKARGWL